MKTLIKVSAVILILLNVCLANDWKYKLTVTNLNYTSEKSLQFDIYLLNTNSDKEEFKYALGQYFLEFNPGIANGGTLTYSIVGSELPEAMRPRNPHISGNQLCLVVNPVSSSKDNLPLLLSNDLPGLLIARVNLETSADKFSSETLNLKWTDASVKIRTKIFSYIDNKLVEVTNSENHIIDFGTTGMVMQNNVDLPKEYSLLQNYPNPFNPETKIRFNIPKLSNIKLIVYDITGRAIETIVNQELQPGRYEYKFRSENYASGVYFYKIQSGDFSQIKRMVLIK